MNHFYGPWCAWTTVATAAIISCHSHNAECHCTAATFAVSASMFQGEKMMTSLLAVMITFGTQDTGKAGWETVRLAAIVSQPLSRREGKMPGRLMPRRMPLCVWQLPALPESRGGVKREKWWQTSSLRWAAMSRPKMVARWVTKHVLVNICWKRRHIWPVNTDTKVSTRETNTHVHNESIPSKRNHPCVIAQYAQQQSKAPPLTCFSYQPDRG